MILLRDLGFSRNGDPLVSGASLQLHPGSAIGRIEYANALIILEGEHKTQEATALYEQAARR